jgi:hypothetical protein
MQVIFLNIDSLAVWQPNNSFNVISDDRLGGRNVLGLPNSYVVLRRAGKGIEVGPSNNRKVGQFFY